MTAAAPRPAATVVLLRGESGALEVFLVRRHDQVAFMGGAHVFPGGRVDPADRLAHPEALCDGVAGAVSRMPELPAPDAVACHVAAIRELFEEAGVLLARTQDGPMVPIDGDDAARFDRFRRAIMRKEITLVELVRRVRLRLALDALALAAHWVTPAIEATRFDTRFFVALAPDRQAAAHDAHETTDGVWVRPADALAQCRRGEIALPPPTWTMLRMLSRFAAPEEAWRWAAACRVVRVEPAFLVQDDGTRLVMLPGDPLCPAVEGFHAEDTRFLLKDGRWAVVGDAGADDRDDHQGESS